MFEAGVHFTYAWQDAAYFLALIGVPMLILCVLMEIRERQDRRELAEYLQRKSEEI